MGLNETTKQMRDVLMNVAADLEKAAQGNKAAAQRVRTSTIKLEKTAKNYRRESINAEKVGNFPKRPSQQKKAQSNKKQASKPAAKQASKQASKSSKMKAPAKQAPKRAPAKAQKSNSKSAYRR